MYILENYKVFMELLDFCLCRDDKGGVEIFFKVNLQCWIWGNVFDLLVFDLCKLGILGVYELNEIYYIFIMGLRLKGLWYVLKFWWYVMLFFVQVCDVEGNIFIEVCRIDCVYYMFMVWISEIVMKWFLYCGVYCKVIKIFFKIVIGSICGYVFSQILIWDEVVVYWKEYGWDYGLKLGNL